MNAPQKLCENLDYAFRNEDLLREALTHPSVPTKKGKMGKARFNYERLEFLGDSILSLVITEYLTKNYAAENEGELSKRRAALVSSRTISKIAEEKARLGEFMIMSEGERNAGGGARQSNLENCMEAVVGAIFLDSDYGEARRVVLRLWMGAISQLVKAPQSSKMELQEWSQKRLKMLPLYAVVGDVSGKDGFVASVGLKGFEKAEAGGKSKKEAENAAAELMLKQIRLRGNKRPPRGRRENA
ncbi:MAG: ribonuclease III [Rickettsiales bacterium]|nr:ribonuclease III [Rickettsiales bacterium]